MSLSNQQIQQVEDVLKQSLRHKFQNYNPEPAVMPFHTRLLGKDRMALFSFIHSLNTNFGTSIFEPVALTLAQENFKEAQSQATAGTQISETGQKVIQNIMDDLSAAQSQPNKIAEIEAIRSCLRFSKQKRYKSQYHKVQCGIILSLAVFPKPTLLFKPCKASFYHPPFGNYFKCM